MWLRNGLGFWWALLAAMPGHAAEPVDLWQTLAEAVAPTPQLHVRVQVQAPGHSAEAAETLAAVPVERALISVAGLQSMVSLSTEGQTRLALTIKAEPFAGLRQVADLLRNLRTLPEDVLPPTVARAGGERIAMLAVPDSRWASLFQTALERTPGVARVAVCGPGAPEIQVEVDTRRLPPDLGGGAGVVRALSGVIEADLEALGAVLLTPTTRLSDVATIRLTELPGCRCVAAGVAAVCLAVWSVDRGTPDLAPTLGEVSRSLPAGQPRSMPMGARFEVWGSLASEATASALAATVRKAAPEAWLQVWPDRFWVSVPTAGSVALVAILDAVAGLDRAGSRRDGVATPTVWVTVASGDAAELAVVAASVAKHLGGQGATEARIWRPASAPELEVKTDREALARLGVSVAAVARATRLALAGEVLGRSFSGPELRVFADRVSGHEALAGLLVNGPDGQRIALGAVARIVSAEGAPARWRLNSQRAQPIQVSGLEGEQLTRALGQAVLPAGAALVVGPEASSLFDAHR